MVRRILAVVVGYILWSILWLGSNQFFTFIMPGAIAEDGTVTSTILLVLLFILSVVFSLAAGFVVGFFTKLQPIQTALWLGLALLATGIIVQVVAWSKMPAWYHLLFLGFLVPSTVVGASVAQARMPEVPAPPGDSQ
jgi:hypothetical protein